MTQPTKSKLIFRSELDFSGLRFRKRKETLGCTVHCSASKPSQNWTSLDVDAMHRRRGFICIGYHFIIARDGVVYTGRPADVQAAHAKDGGRNKTHISFCLIGGVSQHPQKHVPGNPWNGSDAECNFTTAQEDSYGAMIEFMKGTYGFSNNQFEGHRDIRGVTKACPSHNVKRFIETGVLSLN